MKLDQFDKLEHNVRKSIKYIIDLKLENKRLQKEVEQLKKQLETTGEKGTKDLKDNNSSNSVREALPKAKTDTVVSQLDEVIKKMKSFAMGVES